MFEETPLRILATAVVPVAIMSACSLLCLAFYNRLATIVSRIRSFQRERISVQERIDKHPVDADPQTLKQLRHFDAIFDQQTEQLKRRAHLIRRTLLCLLLAILCLVICSASAGASLVWWPAQHLAVGAYFIGLGFVVVAIGSAIWELLGALYPIEHEARLIDRLVERRNQQNDPATLSSLELDE